MASNRKLEARALAADERRMVGKSRAPALQELSATELSALVKLVRERRDRARTMAERRRREMRGKAAPRGAAPAKADEGSKLKLAVLAAALRRLTAEVQRRRRARARKELVGSAKKALAMRRAAEPAKPANTRRAARGMTPKENPRAPELIRPMERGRLRKANAVAQARRDARS